MGVDPSSRAVSSADGSSISLAVHLFCQRPLWTALETIAADQHLRSLFLFASATRDGRTTSSVPPIYFGGAASQYPWPAFLLSLFFPKHSHDRGQIAPNHSNELPVIEVCRAKKLRSPPSTPLAGEIREFLDNDNHRRTLERSPYVLPQSRIN